MSLDVWLTHPNGEIVHEGNITHNLGAMAAEAGIYDHLWRPERIGMDRAWKMVDPLHLGLTRMQLEPERFKKFNPLNGWGDYEGLVKFVSEYLRACRLWGEAHVSVWR